MLFHVFPGKVNCLLALPALTIRSLGPWQGLEAEGAEVGLRLSPSLWKYVATFRASPAHTEMNRTSVQLGLHTWPDSFHRDSESVGPKSLTFLRKEWEYFRLATAEPW